MREETMPIARVVLARDIRRILALPLLLGLTGLSAAGAGLLLGGMAEPAAVVAGAIVIAAAILLAFVPLSLRMEVEVGGLGLHWLGGSRHFHLARGPVTRVALTGSSAGSIRSRFPVLGWSFGRAVLRGEERIILVRLARTPNVIVVPTDAGRVAIAAASETDLLEALGAAARVQQRLDEVGGRVLAAFPEGLAALEAPSPSAGPTEEERQGARGGGSGRGGGGHLADRGREGACGVDRSQPGSRAPRGDLVTPRMGDRCPGAHPWNDQLGARSAGRIGRGLGSHRGEPGVAQRRHLGAPRGARIDARRTRGGAGRGGRAGLVAAPDQPDRGRRAGIPAVDRPGGPAMNLARLTRPRATATIFGTT
ncbi:MAG: hypothetical protein E6I62_08125 [Chloroflexi bacterium]|nr:MAG: hypothetical protein E6I62_08125 [Chloroflexota bacterium]